MSEKDKIKDFYKDLFDEQVNEKLNEDIDALKSEVEKLKQKNNLKAKELFINKQSIIINASFSF